jgi:hypothetical protein
MFSWKIILKKDNYMHVKLNFVDPKYVGTSLTLSELEITMGEGKQYKSKSFGRFLPDGIRKQTKTYRQESKDATTKTLGDFAKGMKAVLEVLSAGGPFF